MTLTIGDIEQVKTEMCDSYCVRPFEAADQEELDEFCKYCPLNNFIKEVTIND